MNLSEKSRSILQAIAKGQTYEQILIQDLAWTYHDIFRAAEEALQLNNTEPKLPQSEKSYSVDEIRKSHPQAYEPWDELQDDQLRSYFRLNKSSDEIARLMQRNRGAIQSRLKKLNLLR